MLIIFKYTFIPIRYEESIVLVVATVIYLSKTVNIPVSALANIQIQAMPAEINFIFLGFCDFSF